MTEAADVGEASPGPPSVGPPVGRRAVSKSGLEAGSRSIGSTVGWGSADAVVSAMDCTTCPGSSDSAADVSLARARAKSPAEAEQNENALDTNAAHAMNERNRLIFMTLPLDIAWQFEERPTPAGCRPAGGRNRVGARHAARSLVSLTESLRGLEEWGSPLPPGKCAFPRKDFGRKGIDPPGAEIRQIEHKRQTGSRSPNLCCAGIAEHGFLPKSHRSKPKTDQDVGAKLRRPLPLRRASPHTENA